MYVWTAERISIVPNVFDHPHVRVLDVDRPRTGCRQRRVPTSPNQPRSALAAHFDSLLSFGVRHQWKRGSVSIHRADAIWDERSSGNTLEITRVTSCPTIQLPTVSSLVPHRPPRSVMTNPEPWAVDDTPTDVANHKAITAVLNADIETLTAFKDVVGSTPVKAVFESVIGILTLVRVRFLVLCSFSRQLIGSMTSTGW